MKPRKQLGKMFFDIDTPETVCNLLNRYNEQRDKTRIRIFYGDTETGKCWLEEYDIMGYVGCSMGPVKIPLLINNKRSIGGGAILDNCIVKITENKRTVYIHPTFHFPVMLIDGFQLLIDGEVYARCESPRKAGNLLLFLHGETNTKNHHTIGG